MSPILSPANGSASPLPPMPPPPVEVVGTLQNCNSNSASQMSNLVKKDLVVRFTEFQNSVQHVTSTTPLVTRGQERPASSNVAMLPTSASASEIIVCCKSDAERHFAERRSSSLDGDELHRYHEGRKRENTVIVGWGFTGAMGGGALF